MHFLFSLLYLKVQPLEKVKRDFIFLARVFYNLALQMGTGKAEVQKPILVYLRQKNRTFKCFLFRVIKYILLFFLLHLLVELEEVVCTG